MTIEVWCYSDSMYDYRDVVLQWLNVGLQSCGVAVTHCMTTELWCYSDSLYDYRDVVVQWLTVRLQSCGVTVYDYRAVVL